MGTMAMATTKVGWTRWAVGLAVLTISWNYAPDASGCGCGR